MGKIDLTYVKKHKTAEAQAKEVKEVVEENAEEKAAEEKELFGETYEQFKSRLDREFDEAMAAIRAMKELGI